MSLAPLRHSSAPPPPQSTTDAPPLNEVAVFASRYALAGSEIGGPLGLDREEVQRTPGSEEDSLRAIRTVPGLASSLSSRPFVRGAFLEDVLVRFDGIPLEDPFHFKNFQGLISAFDPATIDRIDVFTGGFPVKYGTRSAGVIDIAPRSEPAGYQNRVGASLYSYDASTVGRADELPVEWLGSIRHSTQILSLEPRNGDIGEPGYLDTLGRVRWKVNPDVALTLGWMLLDDRVQLSADPSSERANAHDRDIYSWIAANWDPARALHSRTSVALMRTGNAVCSAASRPEQPPRATCSNAAISRHWTRERNGHFWGRLDFVGYRCGSNGRNVPISASPGTKALLLRWRRSWAAHRSRLRICRRACNPRCWAFFGSGRWQWHRFEAELGARFDRQEYRNLGAHSHLTPRINLRFDPAPLMALVWLLGTIHPSPTARGVAPGGPSDSARSCNSRRPCNRRCRTRYLCADSLAGRGL